MARCRPGHFDPNWYLRTYGDVAAAGAEPLKHYLLHGRSEGRQPCQMTAAWRERDLRWGMLEDEEDALEALARHGTTPANRAWAALACARAAARRDDWAGADAWLRPLDLKRDLVDGFCLPDHALLAIEAALISTGPASAWRLWKIARRAFGPLPDLHLSAANISAARGGHGRDWRGRMARLYARAGLTGMAVAPGTAPALDRVRAPRLGRVWRDGPLVSVIMPARDAGSTIATALHSLRAQSWRRLEILVVDNGSVDATASIAHRHARDDARIRVLDGSAEPGAYPARNIGMAAATGDFITVLDADDWAHPDRIARQVRALLRRPGPAASVSSWVRVTPGLRFTRWWGDAGLIHRNVSSLMIRAGLRERLGYWDRARVSADTEYHDRIQSVFGAGAIHQVCPGLPLSLGRVRERSLTQSAETRVHSLHFGPRRSYLMAARRWHAAMRRNGGQDATQDGARNATQDGAPGTLPLPQYPRRRCFDIPPELALGDPPAVPGDDPVARIAASVLFDERWYMQTYPDLRARDLDAATHYLTHGAAEGRDPGPGFSTSGYRTAHGPLDQPPLLHYLDEGRARGLSPLPVFDGALSAPGPGRHLLFFGHQANAHVFGAERSLLDMLARAVTAGFVPSVVMPRLGNAAYLEALRQQAYRVHVLPYGWLFGGVAPHPATLTRLSDLIRQSGAVEVHQNTLVMDAPLRAARAARVPSVVHVRELPAEDPQLCMDLGVDADELHRTITGLTTRFIANSDTVARWLDLPRERVTVLPNTVDPALAALPFAPADPPRVALIGSLSVKKGVADFLAVARAVGGRAQFLLIGPETPELAGLGPLPGNVSHRGYAPTPAAALAQADIVLSLSHFAESFGRTVLEAMTAGRPVICYDRGTPPDLLGDSGAGRVVPADTPAAVARALTAMLATPGGLSAMSAAARTRAAALARAARAVPDAALFGASER